MKKLMPFLGMLAISSTGFAGTMDCQIGFTTASSGGLMPSEKIVTLKTTSVQKPASLDLKKCSVTLTADLKINLCAVEDAEALGIYKAEVVIEDPKGIDNGLNFSVADNLLATAKNGGKLIALNSKSALSPVFIKKMVAANLEFPEYQGGDSLMIDEAVAGAVKKGVLAENDIVTIAITSCSVK